MTVALLNRDAQVNPPADALPTDSSDSSRGAKGTPIGAIVGGVIGGLTLLILLALLIFFCMRRKCRRRQEIKSATQSFPRSPYESQPKADSPFAALGGELSQHFPKVMLTQMLKDFTEDIQRQHQSIHH